MTTRIGMPVSRRDPDVPAALHFGKAKWLLVVTARGAIARLAAGTLRALTPGGVLRPPHGRDLPS